MGKKSPAVASGGAQAIINAIKSGEKNKGYRFIALEEEVTIVEIFDHIEMVVNEGINDRLNSKNREAI